MFWRAWLIISATLLTAGCRTSYYAEKGDERAVHQQYSQAIANYDYALTAERGVSEEERAAILVKRRSSIASFTDQILAEADQQATIGQHDQAMLRLASALVTPAIDSDAARQRLRAALDEVAEQRWRQLEEQFREKKYLGFIAVAERLVQMVPENIRFQERLENIRKEAAYYHQALAAMAPREARLFHLRAAQRFGAMGFEAELGALYAESVRLVQPNYLLSSPESADPQCAKFLGHLSQVLGENREGRPVPVQLSFEHCVQTEKRWSEKEVFKYPSWIAEPEIIDEQYYASAAESCPESSCLRYDALGVCVLRASDEKCQPNPLSLRTRETEVLRYRTTTATVSAEVARRRLASGVKGSFRIDISSMTHSGIFDRIFSLEEREVWTPAQSSRFSTSQVDDLSKQVAAEVGNLVRTQYGAFRHQLEQQEVTRGNQLRAQGHEQQAEALYIAASFFGGYPPPGANEYFAFRYGIASHTVMQLLQGIFDRAPAPVAALYLGSPDGEDYRYVPIDPGSSKKGAEFINGTGVDIFTRTETSPLDSAQWFQSLGGRFRFDEVVITLEGRVPELAGDSSGMHASLRCVFGDVRDDGFALLAGLGWEHERTETRERRYFFGAPVSLILPVGDVLSLEAMIELNFLHLKKWTDDQPNDPRFYSPISLRAEIDLGGRGYFGGVIRHHLGAGKERLIDGGLELGFRL